MEMYRAENSPNDRERTKSEDGHDPVSRLIMKQQSDNVLLV